MNRIEQFVCIKYCMLQSYLNKQFKSVRLYIIEVRVMQAKKPCKKKRKKKKEVVAFFPSFIAKLYHNDKTSSK